MVILGQRKEAVETLALVICMILTLYDLLVLAVLVSFLFWVAVGMTGERGCH